MRNKTTKQSVEKIENAIFSVFFYNSLILQKLIFLIFKNLLNQKSERKIKLQGFRILFLITRIFRLGPRTYVAMALLNLSKTLCLWETSIIQSQNGMTNGNPEPQ